MIIGATSAAAADSKPLKLRLAHGWSPKHHVHVILDQWTKDVEQRTDGRVKITIFPGGALSTARQLYELVIDSAQDQAITHRKIGEIYEAQGETAKARREFMTSLSFEPDNSQLQKRVEELRK